MIFHPAHRVFALFLLSTLTWLARAGDDYEPGPDSKPQPGVPKGEVLGFSFEQSKIFPGTYRDYWIYVPAQYTPDKPACLYVNQDGIQWQAPTVFDNLIHKREMPVTIGVFVMHGRVRAADTNAALDRFNRSYEYDGLGDNYVRFLLEELLPDVAKRTTSDGRPIRISTNGNDRAIGGSSSGAICAFTAAWERPDAFSRVFSAIGTYVGLRGGDGYPTLIRKYEPKPIRIFMQGGSEDLNIYGGDWWMANQMMERALTFAGYEVNHVWGDGGHNGKHGTAIFPDAMRWLWKDWPQPVKAGQSKNATLTALLIPGEDWEVVWRARDDEQLATHLVANLSGEVLFGCWQHRAPYQTFKIRHDGKIEMLSSAYERFYNGAFGPDGLLYRIFDGKLLASGPRGKSTQITEIQGTDLVVAHNGNTYIAEESVTNVSKVWLVRANGDQQVVDAVLPTARAIALSPDQTLLYVAVPNTKWVYSYQIQPTGLLTAKQPYYWLHAPPINNWTGTHSLAVDRDGRLYVSTWLGIQICDQAGRVQCILATPTSYPDKLCFGGRNFEVLFASSRDAIYKRKLKTVGANAWAPPHRPAPPRL